MLNTLPKTINHVDVLDEIYLTWDKRFGSDYALVPTSCFAWINCLGECKEKVSPNIDWETNLLNLLIFEKL